MQDKRKQRRVFHINMLAKWESPTAACLFCRDSIRKTTGDIFSDKPGRTSAAQITINTGDAKPIYLPPYRLPAARVGVAQEEIRQLLQAGIIEKSDSPWAALVWCWCQRKMALWLCVDYRYLNKVTKPDPYPMPWIDELLDGLGAAKFITMLDLAKGYWQVPVSPDSIPKTAVSPFAASYLDDVAIFSKSWTDLQYLRAVLMKLRKAGLTAKLSKCQFDMNECQFLGHMVGDGQIHPDDAKVAAVHHFN